MANIPARKRVLYFVTHPGVLYRNISYRLTNHISTKKHIFIVGVPRSGTTLLKTVLATHPRLVGSDWESTGIFGFRDIFQYDMGELESSEIKHILRSNSNIISFYDKITDALLARSNKDLFVDKLQIKGYRLSYVHKHFPNAVFINIVRDGRDCFCSAKKHPHVRQSEALASFARYWAKCNRIIQKSITNEKLFHLRYEDLTNDSEQTVKDIMNFIGVEFSPEQVQVEHFSATNSMKRREVHQNLARPISSRSQKRWVRELSKEEQNTFWEIAGEELSRYGYEREPAISDLRGVASDQSS